jgi:putative addiction module CopG family antidote
MNVRLRPEIQKLIQQDVARGPYQSVDDFVEKAVTMLHEQEAWLAANRSDINAKIEEGFASAQRGELIDPDEVRSRMADRKRAPLSI